MSPCQPFPGLHCWSVWIKPSSSIQGQPPAAATCPLCPRPPLLPGLSPSMQGEKGLYCPSLFSEAEDDPGAQRSLINFMTDSPALLPGPFLAAPGNHTLGSKECASFSGLSWCFGTWRTTTHAKKTHHSRRLRDLDASEESSCSG